MSSKLSSNGSAIGWLIGLFVLPDELPNELFLNQLLSDLSNQLLSDLSNQLSSELWFVHAWLRG